MKTKFITLGIIALISVTSFITSCGKDGIDGETYLSISDDGNCISSYTDDNPCIPYGFSYGVSYGPCDEGTYDYEYYFCSSSGWYGTYSIYVNEGTEGGFLHNGEDGSDEWSTFYLGTGGGYILRKGETAPNDGSDIVDGKFTRHYNMGRYSITITGQRIERPLPGSPLLSKGNKLNAK